MSKNRQILVLLGFWVASLGLVIGYTILTHEGPWGLECKDGTRRFSCNWADAAVAADR